MMPTFTARAGSWREDRLEAVGADLREHDRHARVVLEQLGDGVDRLRAHGDHDVALTGFATTAAGES